MKLELAFWPHWEAILLREKAIEKPRQYGFELTRKLQRASDKKHNQPLIFCPYFSYTSPIYDVSFIGLLHPLSKIICCKYNRTDLKSPECKRTSRHTRN